MIRLSASLIKDFLVCPRRAFYRLSHPEQAISSKEMVAGNIVHKVVELYWNDYSRAVEEIDNQIKINNFKHNPSAIYRNVDNFFELYPFSFDASDKVEEFFQVQYKNDITLVGKMDRIHQGYVLDWKTGEREPEDVNRDIQFIMYFLCYKIMYGEEPKGVHYVSLPKKKIFPFTPNREIIAVFENETLPYVANMISKRAFPANGLYGFKACDYCSFSDTCWTELSIE